MESIDLRYGFPALINSLLLFLKPRPIDLEYPILIITAMLVLVVLVLLFLVTSIKFSFNDMEIRFETEHFSAPVAILLLASIMFPPSLFWVIYFLLIIPSSFHEMLFKLLKRFLSRLLHPLRSRPPLIISLTPQRPPFPASVDATQDVNGSAAGQPTESPIQELEPNFP